MPEVESTEEVKENLPEESSAKIEDDKDTDSGTLESNHDNVELSEDEKKYTSELGSYSRSIGHSLKNIGRLMSEDLNIGDESWRAELIGELDTMQDTINKSRELSAPEKFSELHSVFLKSLDEYEQVVVKLPKAIDNLDNDLLNECSDHLQNGGAYTKEASDILHQLDKSN